MARNNTSQPAAKEKSKPVLQFSVLCDGVANGQGGKPVFIGIFDNFVRTGIIPQFFIVNRWIYGMGKFKQKIAIKNPDLNSNVVEVADQEFVLQNETSPANIVSGLVNVNFEKVGVYWVEISLDDELVMSYPLPVYDQQK